MNEKKEILTPEELVTRFNPSSLYKEAIKKIEERKEYYPHSHRVIEVLSNVMKVEEKKFIEKYMEPGKIEETRNKIRKKIIEIIESIKGTEREREILHLKLDSLGISPEDLPILKEMLKLAPDEVAGPGGVIGSSEDITASSFYSTAHPQVVYREAVMVKLYNLYSENPDVRTIIDLYVERPESLNWLAYSQ